MWGEGATYEETIPSYLSNFLCEEGVDVKITNYGMHWYKNIQSFLKLILQLKEGKRPDIVIFYDGVNDIRSNNPNPNKPYPMTHRVFQFYLYRQRPFSNITSYLNSLIEYVGLANNTFYQHNDIDFYFSNDYIYWYSKGKGEEPAVKITESYMNNVKIIKSLESSYNFKSFFYWQPNLGTKRNLSDEEKELLENHKSDYYKRVLKDYAKGYSLAKKILSKNTSYVFNISDIFDDYPDQIFTDECHKLPIGNKIVAERMAEDIIKYLNDKKDE